MKTAGGTNAMTAAEKAYAAKIAEARALVARMSAALDTHAFAQAKNAGNWCHVGEMTEIVKLLGEVEAFASGREV